MSAKRPRPFSTSTQLTKYVATSKGSRTGARSMARKGPQANLAAPLYRGVKWGFPLRLYMKHSYCENVSVASTTGSLGTYKFRANSLFDPNQTGTGHQPQYFDNCGAIYDHYTVLKSKIKVTFTHISASIAVPVAVAVITDDDTTAPATMQAFQECNRGGYKICQPDASAKAIISVTWNASDTFGPNPLANDNLQGTLTTGPTEEQYFIIGAQALNGGSQTMAFTAEIEFWAVWDELKTQDEN